ncbi:hypothetical protein Rhe02_83440 [Rhizocola hellebori]|uniref:Glycerophosphoryl diester phosphodiesterase membrane domain-containing protein n=1 Tax=Rhizocola hellebori TaxID=1392758 RepID=A0A8J3QHS3_9ACTN|nr:hypothetical protein [Rhizocola hellebori]GIH10277.1 hypothetical protein Rhe02_83440 [Rhizocola hellebori]
MTDPYAPQNHVPQGYLPPADAYLQPYPGGPDPNDPLVNPPHSGINGWFTRIGGLFKRSWKSMAAIFAITHLVPTIALAVMAAVGVVLALGTVLPTGPSRAEFNAEALSASIPIIVAGAFVAIIILIYVQMAGYAAATYAVTRQAAGYQVRLGESLGYGFRRGWGLFGWQFVVGLLILLGFVACILPAFYVYAATALFGPIYLFERRNPIGRTFSIFNNNLGRVLGRLALLLVATFVANGVTTIFDQVGSAVAGNTGEIAVIMGAAAISSTLGIIIELPLTMLIFSGILLTYTEQRGWEGPATARTLADELANPSQQLALAG